MIRKKLRNGAMHIPVIGILFAAVFDLLIKGPGYECNPKGSDLSEKELRALAVGHIIGAQRDYYIDSFETGKINNHERDGLEKQWKINDRESAIETLNRLKDFGERLAYNYISPVVKSFLAAREGQKIEKLTKEEGDAFIKAALQNLAEDIGEDKVRASMGDTYETASQILPRLTQEEFQLTGKVLDQLRSFINNDLCIFPLFTGADKEYEIFDDADISGSILAWDAGRLAAIARISANLGYIAKEEAWEYINWTYEAVSKEYRDWKDFGRAYLVGRLIWGGNNSMLGGIVIIVEDALNPEYKSPWVKIKFKN